MTNPEYSQGVCQDGAAILKDGEPMTIEEILDELKAARVQQPNLSTIAQKKLDQMIATVHGVLAKNEAGAWVAVSDAGRVMWLDNFEGQADLVQQAGSGEAVAWDSPAVDPIVTKLYRRFKEWSQRGFTADDVTWCEVRGYVAELLNARPQSAQQGSVPEAADMVLASLGHYQTESGRCRARYKEVATNVQGPKNPPVFCVLAAGHEGQHRGQHGAKMRDNLIEFGSAISVCAKCKVRWPCPDAEKAFNASATPQPADKACKWHSDDNGCWMSECGKEWYFEDGGPEDNGMNFCVKCGNRCIEIGDSEGGSESYDSAM